jgi:hypothetical protein
MSSEKELAAAFAKLNAGLREAGFVTREEAAKARKMRVLKAAAIVTTVGIVSSAVSYIYNSNKNALTPAED